MTKASGERRYNQFAIFESLPPRATFPLQTAPQVEKLSKAPFATKPNEEVCRLHCNRVDRIQMFVLNQRMFDVCKSIALKLYAYMEAPKATEMAMLRR